MNNSRSGGGVVLAASGAGGDHPGGGGGRKGMDGHYSSDPGEFKPLPPGIKMAQEPRARPQRRQRAMSLPNAMDLGFYGTMRSVLTHGILPQPVMRERGIGFSPSHDGNRRESNEVEVTRVPRVDDVRQQRGIVRRAVENPYHGSLTVALERSSEMQYRPQSDHEVRSGMSSINGSRCWECRTRTCVASSTRVAGTCSAASNPCRMPIGGCMAVSACSRLRASSRTRISPTKRRVDRSGRRTCARCMFRSSTCRMRAAFCRTCGGAGNRSFRNWSVSTTPRTLPHATTHGGGMPSIRQA